MAERNACCDIVIVNLTRASQKQALPGKQYVTTYVRKTDFDDTATEFLAQLRKRDPQALEGMYVIPDAERGSTRITDIIQLGRYTTGGAGQHGFYSTIAAGGGRVNVAGGRSHNLFGTPGTAYTFPTLSQLSNKLARKGGGAGHDLFLVGDESSPAEALRLAVGRIQEARQEREAGERLAKKHRMQDVKAKASKTSELKARHMLLKDVPRSGLDSGQEEAIKRRIREDPGFAERVDASKTGRELRDAVYPERSSTRGGGRRTHRRRVHRRRRTAHKKRHRRQRKTRQLTCSRKCRRELMRKSKRVSRGRSRGRRTRRSR